MPTRAGSGLDSINFGSPSAGGGVSSYNDLTDVPANVLALGVGDPITAATVTDLHATNATVDTILTLDSAKLLSTSQRNTSEGAPGTTNDKALPGSGWTIWMVGTDNANNTYSGLVAENDRDFVIYNKGPTGTLTLKHQDAGSAAANRIICPAATDVVLTVGKGCRVFYDISVTRWRVVQG